MTSRSGQRPADASRWASFWEFPHADLIPAAWLLLYGAGILAGSSASVPVLAWLGALFMVIGTVSLFTPPAWRDVWLGAGFGVLQIVFGAYIARNHGG